MTRSRELLTFEGLEAYKGTIGQAHIPICGGGPEGPTLEELKQQQSALASSGIPYTFYIFPNKGYEAWAKTCESFLNTHEGHIVYLHELKTHPKWHSQKWQEIQTKFESDKGIQNAVEYEVGDWTRRHWYELTIATPNQEIKRPTLVCNPSKEGDGFEYQVYEMKDERPIPTAKGKILWTELPESCPDNLKDIIKNKKQEWLPFILEITAKKQHTRQIDFATERREAFEHISDSAIGALMFQYFQSLAADNSLPHVMFYPNNLSEPMKVAKPIFEKTILQGSMLIHVKSDNHLRQQFKPRRLSPSKNNKTPTVAQVAQLAQFGDFIDASTKALLVLYMLGEINLDDIKKASPDDAKRKTGASTLSVIQALQCSKEQNVEKSLPPQITPPSETSKPNVDLGCSSPPSFYRQSSGCGYEAGKFGKLARRDSASSLTPSPDSSHSVSVSHGPAPRRNPSTAPVSS